MSWYTVLQSILITGVASGTVVLFATIGEIITEKSGICNLGIEGMMLMGACVGFGTAFHYNSIALGILLAGVVGLLLSLIFAFLTITLRTNQYVTGIALTTFGTGLSAMLGEELIGKSLSHHLPNLAIPLLSKIPLIGLVFFDQNILVYLSYVLVICAWIFLNKTKYGLGVKSAGEEPLASEIMGIHVIKIRYLCTIFGGFLAGIAGAYLSLCYTPFWVEKMTSGKGWIVIALVIFANWNPYYAFGGAFLFGILEAMQPRLQAMGFHVPTFLLNTIPYLATIVFLLYVNLRGRISQTPKSLGIPYFRENRD